MIWLAAGCRALLDEAVMPFGVGTLKENKKTAPQLKAPRTPGSGFAYCNIYCNMRCAAVSGASVNVKALPVMSVTASRSPILERCALKVHTSPDE